MNLDRGVARLVVVTLLGLLVACGRHGDAQSVANAPEYVVGSDASYAPFEYLDDHQAVRGFDVDLLTEIGKRAGFRVRFVNTPWEGIFGTLGQPGGSDILASSITITPERQRSIDFSDPYFDARQLIAVGRGHSDIRSFRDLRNETVAVQVGTTADEDLQRLLGHGSPNIKRYQTMSQALSALQQGLVMAVVGDNGVVAGFVKAHPGAGIITIEDTGSFAPEHYGFAVRKGNAALRDKINTGLRAVRADGTYSRIYSHYFGDSR